MRRSHLVFNLYEDNPLWVRFHNFIRFHTLPLEKIADFVPKRGKILELGCGYGVVSNYLSITSPDREIFGIDISPKKIREAQKTVKTKKNIKFGLSDISNPDIYKTKYNCIIILDVLYLIAFEKWGTILKNCYNALEDGGVLILKEQGKEPMWKYYWNLFQEFLAVRVFKITEGSGFTFPDEDTIKDLIKNIGFSLDSLKLDKGYLHPHILFVCRKDQNRL